MPFNGLEFGEQIIKEKNLSDVVIEGTKGGDHYDPNEKKVRVKQERLDNKSITAISVVCHEIGHAIQHNENYKPLERRQILVKNTAWISKLGGGILYIGLPTLFATGSFPLIRVCLILVIFTIIINVLIHLVTLDVEIDASFNRLQFTPDLLPADIIGTQIYSPKSERFSIKMYFIFIIVKMIFQKNGSEHTQR